GSGGGGGRGGRSARRKPQKAMTAAEQRFMTKALDVWKKINAHKYAIIFRKPVSAKDAPGYDEVVHEPMDLSLIKKRIDDGAIASLEELARCAVVMCTNAMVFNGAGSEYYDYAKELRDFAREKIEEASVPGSDPDPFMENIVVGARVARGRTDGGNGGGNGGGSGGGGGGSVSGGRSS
ncbi:unnamed protein product, partial [Phaeothamnion confervicola]